MILNEVGFFLFGKVWVNFNLIDKIFILRMLLNFVEKVLD